MALYPEVQKKAQAEIDIVVGPNRLPDFGDRPSLPYINAVIKEVMRWHLVVPLGEIFFFIITIRRLQLYHPCFFSKALPHMSSNEDEYDGYYIPKGTVVFGNSWSV